MSHTCHTEGCTCRMPLKRQQLTKDIPADKCKECMLESSHSHAKNKKTSDCGMPESNQEMQTQCCEAIAMPKTTRNPPVAVPQSSECASTEHV